MAGGKQTARQKMINLMYLVFIAMLALNMSKEVLTAFGVMDERLIDANAASTARNNAFMENLATKAAEQPEQYSTVKEKADQISALAADLTGFIENLKGKMMASLKPDDQDNYEVQDKPDALDEALFPGGNISPEGKEFLAKIDAYREGVLALVGEDYPSIAADIEKKFSTEDVRQRSDNVKKPWLKYQFEGFPLIASKTRMSQIQADVKTTQSEILAKMLGSQQEAALSFTQYNTLLEQTKSAFYAGESFDGGIVLGRKDPNTKPNRVELTLDGKPLSESQYTIESGKVKLNISAGAAGDHKIEGNLIFLQDGKEVEIPVSSSFTTINKPNAAVISADEMNVVYRAVPNPITVSIPGISDDKVTANPSGGDWKKKSGTTYELFPGSGKEVIITARGELPDGSIVTSSQPFRIEPIPAPLAAIGGETMKQSAITMSRQDLERLKVSVERPAFFKFPLNMKVKEFGLFVPGQPTLTVKGDSFDESARSLLRRAPRGSTISIRNIKAEIIGNTAYILPNIAPLTIDLTN
jgi:gliding motility-associated protein GldM